MAEFQLYCFAQSGNAYRAALMLNLISADWEPVWIDFFGAMVQRTPEFRGPVGARNGAISPDGGCPANFYMSRRWVMQGSVLTIADEENQPLAELRPGSIRFEGQSTGGMPITLSR